MFRRELGKTLFASGAGLVISSILLRYAMWSGGALTNAMQYWLQITLSESGLWLAMFVVGLCIVIADHLDGSNTPKAGPIG